jgi:hypothetical protein
VSNPLRVVAPMSVKRGNVSLRQRIRAESITMSSRSSIAGGIPRRPLEPWISSMKSTSPLSSLVSKPADLRLSNAAAGDDDVDPHRFRQNVRERGLAGPAGR